MAEKGVEALTGEDEEKKDKSEGETAIEMNGDIKGLRVTASIEDGGSTPPSSTTTTPDQSLQRKSSNSTNRSKGSSSWNSIDSFSSHDVLIVPDK